MSATTTSFGNRRAMLAKAHIAKKELGLDDDTYRSVLMRVTGKPSSAKMTFAELDEVLAEFKAQGWKPALSFDRLRMRTRSGSTRENNYRRTAANAGARKVYVLWRILRENNRVGANRPDGFVRRMTGKDRAELLGSDETGMVIEALKAMIVREGLAEHIDD